MYLSETYWEGGRREGGRREDVGRGGGRTEGGERREEREGKRDGLVKAELLLQLYVEYLVLLFAFPIGWRLLNLTSSP